MSLPAWECGLKPNTDAKPLTVFMSLPAWECGLKHRFRGGASNNLRSLPAWECGLKHFCIYQTNLYNRVTPRVGVWIETPN